jgi:hypothetical protein
MELQAIVFTITEPNEGNDIILKCEFDPARLIKPWEKVIGVHPAHPIIRWRFTRNTAEIQTVRPFQRICIHNIHNENKQTFSITLEQGEWRVLPSMNYKIVQYVWSVHLVDFKYSHWFQSPNYTDAEVAINNGLFREVIKVHKVVLSRGSEKLKNLYERTKTIHVDGNHYTRGVVLGMLQFLYKGYVVNINFIDKELYCLAQEFEMIELVNYCRISIINKLTLKNMDEIYTMALRHRDTKLLLCCKERFKYIMTLIDSTGNLVKFCCS